MKKGLSTIKKYPLEVRKVLKKSIQTARGWVLVVLLIFLPSHLFFFNRFPIAFGVIDVLYALRLVAAPFYEYYYYKAYFYNVQPDFFVIKKGVLLKRETILDYNKIQDVYVDQDLLDGVFGLWDVHVSTATSRSGFEAHIDGVNRTNAFALRELILSKIRKKRK